ncbi:DnaJ C-terminal domain-containing protein [Kitasatospora sp. NPDC092948]|uniref:DnaJ C-terminal domain-containing protein n=1 Tax=Kitasatospora sp. NPDC092948 TaxID=3364088 RepID=UPI00380105BB
MPKRVQEHQVRFPAGLREGQRVRLRGLGERGTNGGENGDLYVTVHIVPDRPPGRRTCDVLLGSPHMYVTSGRAVPKPGWTHGSFW